ncbi:MAG: acyl-CoA dehydrogenase [Sphingomonadales bacterium]|nr:MAG: acyl-CoA dehydrogenase [Sphingomonadales bacterium]
MKLALSESQTLLKDTVTRLFEDESTPERVRAAEESGFDPALWQQLVEMGITTMRAVSPDAGGSTLLDAAIVAEEAGRRLASAPVIEAMVANALLGRAGAELPDGIVTLALAPVEPGRAQVVPAGAIADTIVALDGDQLVAIARPAGTAMVKNIANSPLALIDLSAADRIVLANGADAKALYEAAVEEWKVLTAIALAGLGRQALEMAAAYSLERIQFGKPIGTFQGIAHPLANSATHIDGARLLAWRAIWSIANDHADAGAAVSMAYWWAGQAVEPALQHSVRTFGGYGLSLEYDVQLYFRRAKLLSLLAGNPQAELDKVADRLWSNSKVALPPAGDVEIDFSFGADADAYAAEVRAFVEANIDESVKKKIHHSTSGHHADFHRKMAAAGYAFPDMSVDGSTPRTRYQVMAAAPMWEDMNWTRTPTAVTEFVAKMTALWSQPEAKAEILGKILKGDALGCLGFSEPGSGSDVFGARFSAVRDGEDWVMNGQKMFTTNAHNAHYILMLARTDSSGKKHEGLTMFVMPLNEPGVEIHPVHTLQDERTNIVYWSDVRIADKYRIGEVGDGARVMSSALGFEHGGAGYHAAQTAMIKHAVAWAKKPRFNDGPPINDPTVRRVLAKAATQSEVAEVLCLRQIWADVEGIHDPSYGPMAKMFTTDSMYEDGTALVAVAAPQSLVRGQDHDLDMVEITMRRAIAMTIYGGTSEVHRSLIAEKSLGMPKSRG